MMPGVCDTKSGEYAEDVRPKAIPLAIFASSRPEDFNALTIAWAVKLSGLILSETRFPTQTGAQRRRATKMARASSTC